MSELIVDVQNLCKRYQVAKPKEGILGGIRGLFTREYQTVEALKNVQFQIHKGETVGYIGPNGAGKSTTVKMLCGIMVPTSGTIHSLGYVPYQQRMKYTYHIGVVMGQRTQLWWDLAVIESFKLLAKIYKLSKMQLEEALDIFDAFLQVKDYLHTPVRKLSLGQRMRCDLVASMLHKPPLLFLDEPTIGLDVLAKANIRDFLKKINKELHTTILLTTHDLADIEEVCKRILIIDKGSLVYDGNVPNLLEQMGGQQGIEIVLKEEHSERQILEKLAPFPKRALLSVHYRDSLHFSVTYQGKEVEKAELLKPLVSVFDVSDIKFKEPTIEEVIKKIYQQNLQVI